MYTVAKTQKTRIAFPILIITSVFFAAPTWEQPVKKSENQNKTSIPAKKQYIIMSDVEGNVPVRGPVSEGIELSAIPPTTNFYPGEPVIITVVMKNILTTTSTYFLHSPEMGFDFNVTDPFGHQIPLTEYGHELAIEKAYRSNHGGGSPREGIYFAPNEARSYNILLSRRFNMTALGTYIISVKHRVPNLAGPGKVELTSNPIHVDIR